MIVDTTVEVVVWCVAGSGGETDRRDRGVGGACVEFYSGTAFLWGVELCSGAGFVEEFERGEFV